MKHRNKCRNTEKNSLRKVCAAGGNTSNLHRHLRDHHPVDSSKIANAKPGKCWCRTVNISKATAALPAHYRGIFQAPKVRFRFRWMFVSFVQYFAVIYAVLYNYTAKLWYKALLNIWNCIPWLPSVSSKLKSC